MKLPSKERLDKLLVAQGFASTREKAQAFIMAGYVRVNQQLADKPGLPVDATADIQVLKITLPYVSRGGEKLAGAMAYFQALPEGKELSVSQKVALDIGISTGGFSDYLLQNGAKTVFGVDVGYGQTDLKIRNHPDLVLLERVNARTLTREMLEQSTQKKPEKKQDLDHIQLVVMDVSFISVTKVLPAIQALVPPQTDFIILIKPQFEAQKNQIGKGGIIKDPVIHTEILAKVTETLSDNFELVASCDSPITGTKGNKEFFFWLKNLTIAAPPASFT